jgi:hypothetical protein
MYHAYRLTELIINWLHDAEVCECKNFRQKPSVFYAYKEPSAMAGNDRTTDGWHP